MPNLMKGGIFVSLVCNLPKVWCFSIYVLKKKTPLMCFQNIFLICKHYMSIGNISLPTQTFVRHFGKQF